MLTETIELTIKFKGQINQGSAPMKTMLISAASAIFMFGTAFAREAVVSPIVPSHGARIAAEHRVAQFNSTGEGGIPCTTEYIPTRDDRGWYLRKAVDCAE